MASQHQVKRERVRAGVIQFTTPALLEPCSILLASRNAPLQIPTRHDWSGPYLHLRTKHSIAHDWPGPYLHLRTKHSNAHDSLLNIMFRLSLQIPWIQRPGRSRQRSPWHRALADPMDPLASGNTTDKQHPCCESRAQYCIRRYWRRG